MHTRDKTGQPVKDGAETERPTYAQQHFSSNDIRMHAHTQTGAATHTQASVLNLFSAGLP